jgi:hypothetical protein
VSSDYPRDDGEGAVDTPAEKFSARAGYTSIGTLVAAWLALIGLNVGGQIGHEAFTIGCVAVLLVVGYTAYMWATRAERREIARRVDLASHLRLDVRSGIYRRPRSGR